MPITQSATSVNNLSDILFAEHLISPAQLSDVKVKSATQGIPEEEVLKSLNIVSEDRLSEAKAKLLGVPFISLQSTSFSPQALSFVPRAVVERFKLIPFLFDEKTQTLSI